MIPYFVMMVGIPGCGKSTYAEKIASDYNNATIYSSDAYRKKLFGSEDVQDNPELVFGTLYKDLINDISNGNSVILDATNVTMKDRSRALQRIKEYDCVRIAVVMCTSFEECARRNSSRVRKVPDEVLRRMISKFEVPTLGEGFDEIMFVEKTNISEEDTRNSLFEQMDSFNQNNPHHQYTLGVHSEKVAEQLSENHILCEAGFLHDIGKLYTKTTDEKGISHYFGHANVSAYYILTHPNIIRYPDNCPDKELFKKDLIFVINNHMKIRDIMESKKSMKKYERVWGPELIQLLIDFCYADNNA